MAKAKQKPHGLIISADRGLESFGAVTKDANGQPRKLYRKDLIRVGEFVKASNGQSITVDRSRLQQWADTTNKLIANGTKVPVPSGHDLTGDPDRNRGYLLETYVDGDILFGKIELIGEDAIAAASRSFVSIYSPPEFTDGENNTYEWPIRHVAMTTDPVITRQGEFIPIAAARDETDNADFLKPKSKETTVDLKAIQKKLGISSDLTEENAEEVLFAHVEQVRNDCTGNAEKLAARVKELEAKLKDNKPHELSHSERGMAKRLIESETANLVKDGKITPVVADKLKKTLTSSDMMLSFGASSDPVALEVLGALKENDIVKLGEQTGRQVVELSHQPASDPAGDKDLEKAEKDAKKWAEKEFKKG